LARPKTSASALEDNGAALADEREIENPAVELQLHNHPDLAHVFNSLPLLTVRRAGDVAGLGAAMEVSEPTALWCSTSTRQLVRPIRGGIGRAITRH
jgi:hypothetical protein